MNKTLFENMLKERNVVLNDNHLYLFDNFYKYLVEENEKFNLTAITNEEDVYEKHFYDSLSICFNRKLEGTLIDVGAGAGFPSIPLAIYNSNLRVSVLDSTQKRVNFIDQFAKNNSINIDTVCARAEEFNRKYDFVTARGVAQLNILLELCCNLVKEEGILIAMKGSFYKEEIKNAQNALKTLGYEIIEEQTYSLPSDDSVRCNIYLKKTKGHSSKYPRPFAQIKKKPL